MEKIDNFQLSTLKAKSVDDFGLPEWKKHYLPQKLPAKIRRANSEAQIVLPVLMNKKPGEKLSTFVFLELTFQILCFPG